MSCRLLALRPAALTCAALLLAGNSARAQAPTNVTPRAPSATAGFNSPISPFLFGPPAYPFRATAPSSYRGATLPDQPGGGGVYRGPSLSAPATPPPTSALMHSMQSQPRIGAFVGFAPLSSLSVNDSTLSLPGNNSRPAADNRAHITLHVPTDAQVWFDGKPTKQTGTVRSYHSPELTPGKKYHYEVRARWTKDGKPVEEKRRIEFEARDWLRFDLTRPAVP